MKYSIKFRVIILLLMIPIIIRDISNKDFMGLILDLIVIYANSWRLIFVIKQRKKEF